MQFFPAAPSSGAQFSRPGGLTDLMDAKPGQNFGELFSVHLDESPRPDVPPSATPSPPQSGQDRAFADDAQSCRNRGEGALPASRASENQGASNSGDAAGREGVRPEVCSTEAAKDAGTKQAGTQVEQDGISKKAASKAEQSASDDVKAAKGAEALDESIVVEVQGLLHTLGADAMQRRTGPDAAVMASRIEALHELLRQFKDAPPAGRNEIAVALGEQIRGLRRELGAGTRAEEAGNSRAKRDSAVPGTSLAEKRIDALSHKLDARAAVGGEAVSAQPRRAAHVLPDAAGAVVVKDGQGGRSRQGQATATTGAAVQGASVAPSGRKHAQGGEIAASGVRREGTKEVAARPASGESRTPDAPQGRPEFRGASAEHSSAKSVQAHPGTEDMILSADRNPKYGATDADRTQSAAKGQDGSTRTESATHTAMAAAANRPVDAGKASDRTVRQVDPQSQDRPVGASEKARSAEFGGANRQPDARQGFFGESDREKTASRAPQAAANGRNVPESLTPVSSQASQTQFQQRLESPASARSAHVYQQVENGAFKNLGQGVKQLVIRLDPADLGQVSVILQVRGKEVQAVLRASNQDTSLVLNEQLAQLRSQLEAQGLKVGKLEVQTQLADSQSQSQWQGAENHNRYQENQELAMSARRWRNLDRVASGLVRDVQNTPHRENLSQNGLDIFA